MRAIHRRRSRGGGRGGCSRPKRKFGAENIASGSVKVVCQDIPSSDLFTNRFNRIVFGEVKHMLNVVGLSTNLLSPERH